MEQGKNETKKNLIHHSISSGDPTMFYPYWKKLDSECAITIKASDLLSYFGNSIEREFPFQMSSFPEAVRRIHLKVGNAVTQGRYIIGGTGSSQLVIYALRAVASKANSNTKKKRMPVVCAEPYYSLYAEAVSAEKSDMYEWKGDANTFKEEGQYIEIVTSPNNPDGGCRKPVVNREGGFIIHDLAYYWPQYTPITEEADYDIMLFTMSKATGHAGFRVGWAIVKDPEIAETMMKQVALMNIGSCQEGQLRANKILQFTADTITTTPPTDGENLFEYGSRVLEERWKKLRDVVERTNVFNLPSFPPQHCHFFGKVWQATPGFTWMELKRDDDAEQVMAELGIQVRGGSKFGSGVSGKYVRVSLIGTDDGFNLFLKRLSRLA